MIGFGYDVGTAQCLAINDELRKKERQEKKEPGSEI